MDLIRYKVGQNSIITLQLFPDSKTNEGRTDVYDPENARFRCDKAAVVRIENVATGEEMQTDVSIRDGSFTYTVDTTVSAAFDEDIEKVFASGIHYYKSIGAARNFRDIIAKIPIPDGLYTNWYENGRVSDMYMYKGGQKHGPCIEYWIDGTELRRYNCSGGKLDGLFTSFYQNGNKSKECNYVMGLLHGSCVECYPDGTKM